MNTSGENATASNCAPSRFAVEGLFAPGEYATRSNEAHAVLGGLIFLMILVWSCYIFELIRRPTHATLLSGWLQIAMGLYLYSWVFVLMQPGEVASGRLWAYSTRDLLQLQHIAISGLLVAAGLTDVLFALRWLRIPSRRL